MSIVYIYIYIFRSVPTFRDREMCKSFILTISYFFTRKLSVEYSQKWTKILKLPKFKWINSVKSLTWLFFLVQKKCDMRRSSSSVTSRQLSEPDVSEHFRRSLSGKWPRKHCSNNYYKPTQFCDNERSLNGLFNFLFNLKILLNTL